MRTIYAYALLACIIAPICLIAQEKIDISILQKIKQEEFEHSQVMNIAFNLTDSSGPRLTGSPGFMRAANYAKQQLAQWGLVNAMLDPWGDFGKSWKLKKSYAALSAPYYKPVNAFPKAWCGGTNGLQNADVLLITSKDSAELDAFRGKLAGKILITDRDFVYHQSFEPDAHRFTDAELDSMANIKSNEEDTAAKRKRREMFSRMMGPQSRINELKKMAKEEGAIALLSMIPLSHDGTLFVQGGGSYKTKDPENFLDIQIGVEDYLSIVRLLKAGVPVKMEMDIAVKFYTDDIKGYNVIAEIPGEDPKLKDEIVMLGAHLDSRQGATGATDNAAGCAVMMEAVRILKALDIKPKRTIPYCIVERGRRGFTGLKGIREKNFW